MERILAFLDLEHGAGSCPVLGADRVYGPAAAAFANAASMNALDFDDGFEVDGRGMGHPGSTIVAAALSFISERAISGAEFLTAIIAAYEINNGLIRAIQPSLERFRQVYGVCQHQSIGAAIACAKLAGLEAEEIENVLGFAGTLANVPSLRKYNWESRPLVSFKDFNAPAAETGVRAVQLHRVGLTGAKNVLDGEGGLWRMLGSDQFAPDLLVAHLGRDWTVLQNAFKPYPACRWMHATLEAFEAVMAEHGGGAEIDAVTVLTSAGMARDFMDRAPSTMIDAQFSFPFAVAALALGIAAHDWHRPETLASKAVRAFTARVSAVVDPEVDRLMEAGRRPAGRVLVRIQGCTYDSGLVRCPRGGSDRPMSDKEVLAKFVANARPFLGSGAEAMLASLASLEAQPDLGAIVSNC
jgi:2-methylcitrate dehydratase PrpD